MALCRARPLFGSDEACAKLSGIIHGVLTRAPSATLTADILDMRQKMAGHKPPRGPLDIKLMRGGLVDVEFLIHTLQLREGKALSPRLSEALAGLIEAGLLPPEMAQAHCVMARLLVASPDRARCRHPRRGRPHGACQSLRPERLAGGNPSPAPGAPRHRRRLGADFRRDSGDHIR
jgi:hypothetical protein